MRSPFLLLLALACSPADEPATMDPGSSNEPIDTDTTPSTDTATTDPTDEPAPYIVPDEGIDAVDVDLEAAQEALQAALGTALTVTAVPVQAGYDAAMVGEDDRCPYYYTTPDGTYWYDNCTSAAGTEFNGYAFAYIATGEPDPYSPGVLVDYWSAFGAATVKDADGKLLELGGSAYVARAYGAGYQAWTSVVQGTFQWEGPEAQGTWLETGIDPDFVLYGYALDGLPGAVMYVDGGLGNLEGGWAVAFDENQIAASTLGVSCGTEVSGVVGVRTPDGVWVDVLFDGEPEGQVDAALCDGCGEAWVQGEPVGTMCVDATVLIDWEVSPW
jgi:hypothetical protein